MTSQLEKRRVRWFGRSSCGKIIRMALLMKHDLRVSKNYNAYWADSWLAIQVGVLLCQLPVLLRLYALPTLLHRLTPPDSNIMMASDVKRDRAVRVVLRVCQFRLFCTRLFPLACLRQSLTLYYTLTRLGYPVMIHFGVRKGKEELRGHSWVTVKGMSMAEGGESSAYRIVYSYASDQPGSALSMTEKFGLKAKLF
jgi:hypothetical protein